MVIEILFMCIFIGIFGIFLYEKIEKYKLLLPLDSGLYRKIYNDEEREHKYDSDSDYARKKQRRATGQSNYE